MIPDFEENGNLPPGEYTADWEHIVPRFGWTNRRRELLTGLKAALEPLREAGCRQVFVNGSFVTDKDEPGDIDVAWDPNGVDVDRLLELEPVFGDFDDRRAAQKAIHIHTVGLQSFDHLIGGHPLRRPAVARWGRGNRGERGVACPRCWR